MGKTRDWPHIIGEQLTTGGGASSQSMQDGLGDEPRAATAMEWSCVAGREDVSGERQGTMVVSGGRHDG